MIELGPWLPDRPQVRGPHLRDASGVIPVLEGFAPLPALVEQGGALTARSRGGFAVRDKTGTVHVYAGDATKLYELAADGTWTDRSKALGYSSTSTSRWSFTAYGDRLIASNGIDAVQYIDMSSGTQFADLAGSPPISKIVKAFREFVVLGSTSSSTSKIRWSAINDSTSWTIGTAQADEQQFTDGGQVNAMGATDVLYVFQEKAIRRVRYVGPPTIMYIDLLEINRGCVEPGSFAQQGRLFFFLDEDGFYMFDGAQSTPIGVEQVDSWFRADANRALFYRMSAAVDSVRRLVAWSYVSNSSPSGQPDTLLFYHWPSQKWSYARLSCESLIASLTKGVTLESLDTTYPSIDAMPVSLDDPALAGGSLQFGAFSTAFKLAFFTGANVAATLETGDAQLNPAGRSLVRYVTPIGDTSAATVSVGAKERQGDSFTWSADTAQQTSGRCAVRRSGRFHRARITIPSGSTWSHVNALDLDAVSLGSR